MAGRGRPAESDHKQIGDLVQGCAIVDEGRQALRRAPSWWLARLALAVDRDRGEKLATAHRGPHRVLRRGHGRGGLGVGAVPGVHRAHSQQMRRAPARRSSPASRASPAP